MHIVLFYFSPSFVGGAVIRQFGQYCICLNLLLSRKFAAPLWVPACTLLVYGRTGSDQSEILRVASFRGLNAGTADGPFEGIFSIRAVVCSSEEYMSRPCRPVAAPYVYVLNTIYLQNFVSTVYLKPQLYQLNK